MKIGIITLPFNWNYGGILQCFAMQQSLVDLGHEPIVINRVDKMNPSIKSKIVFLAKGFIRKYLQGKNVALRSWPHEDELNYIKQHTDRFIREKLNTTRLLHDEQEFRKLEDCKLDAYVVGSDQVWRPRYSPRIENHYLEFLGSTKNIKRISYAASFGADEWEYSLEQTQICSGLLKNFHAVSVREDIGVKLCEQHLGVRPELVLDPTFLLNREVYEKLVEEDGIDKMPGTLFNYVLDLSDEKLAFIEKAGQKLGLIPFSSTAKGSFFELGKKRLQDCVFPPVTKWLRAFMDAEFVITDSFHGTVFSIIFNKPFIALGNTKRGLSRFTSMLQLFDLEQRLVTEKELDKLDSVLEAEIDFDIVNEILVRERAKSIAFLEKALKKSS